MKTKSYLFAAASATLMLASCTQNEVVEMPATRAIGFGTYVGNTSRAEAVDTDVPFLKGDGNGFYVFGTYDEPTKGQTVVFNGVSDQSHVTWKETSWMYSPQNYWTIGNKYKFAAYGPAAALNNGTATFDYDKNNISIKGFTADGDLDFVVAEGLPEGYTVNEDAAKGDEVSFKFVHALSKVRFTLVNGWRNDVTLTVTDVKVTGVNSKGDVTTSGTLANPNAILPTTSWENLTEAKEYAWENPVQSDGTIGTTSSVYNEELPFEHFLIPQELGVGEKALTLQFNCKVTNKWGTGPSLGEGAQPGEAVAVSVTIPVDNISSWEPGKAYNYTLIVDGKLFDLLPIEFAEITVSKWEDATDEDLGNEDLTEKPGTTQP